MYDLYEIVIIFVLIIIKNAINKILTWKHTTKHANIPQFLIQVIFREKNKGNP